MHVLLVKPGPFRTDWAGRSAAETLPEDEIADYAPVVGAQRAAFRAGTSKEPGDPARAAASVITAVVADEPPHQLLPGGVAHFLALDQLD